MRTAQSKKNVTRALLWLIEIKAQSQNHGRDVFQKRGRSHKLTNIQIGKFAPLYLRKHGDVHVVSGEKLAVTGDRPQPVRARPGERCFCFERYRFSVDAIGHDVRIKTDGTRSAVHNPSDSKTLLATARRIR